MTVPAFRRGRCRVCDCVVDSRRTYCKEHRPQPYRNAGAPSICDTCPYLESCLQDLWELTPLPCFIDSPEYPAWFRLGYDNRPAIRKMKERLEKEHNREMLSGR